LTGLAPGAGNGVSVVHKFPIRKGLSYWIARHVYIGGLSPIYVPRSPISISRSRLLGRWAQCQTCLPVRHPVRLPGGAGLLRCRPLGCCCTPKPPTDFDCVDCEMEICYWLVGDRIMFWGGRVQYLPLGNLRDSAVLSESSTHGQLW